jgi:molybdopterin-guanine dinucleotide biosynthesis protein A
MGEPSNTLTPSQSLVVGIFVGGRGSRLGGRDKGNLRLPGGERVIQRLVDVCANALPTAPQVLVGASEAYGDLDLLALADEPAGVGPLGGLRALLLHARETGCAGAVVLACDLPYVSETLVRLLATEAPEAAFLAPRSGELWETLTARYSVTALEAVDAALGAGERALQRVIRRLGAGAKELELDAASREELRDWDTPEDLEA